MLQQQLDVAHHLVSRPGGRLVDEPTLTLGRGGLRGDVEVTMCSSRRWAEDRRDRAHHAQRIVAAPEQTQLAQSRHGLVDARHRAIDRLAQRRCRRRTTGRGSGLEHRKLERRELVDGAQHRRAVAHSGRQLRAVLRCGHGEVGALSQQTSDLLVGPATQLVRERARLGSSRRH